MRKTAPSFLTSSLRVFDLSVGEMLWSRRTVFMALIVGLPILLAVLVRVVLAFDLLNLVNVRVGGEPVEVAGATLFGFMIWLFFLRFSVPVLGVFYGTALIADEVEDRTITYLFTRPVRRGAVLMGKYLAYLACTGLVVLPPVMVVYFLLVPVGGGSLGAAFPALVKDLGLLGLGLAVYGAVFALVGAWFKRPLLSGLIFVFGWEPVIVALPGYMKKFTVAHYLQALVPHAMPQDSGTSVLQSILQVFGPPPSVWSSLVWLAVIWVTGLALATRVVERREYVLDQ